MVLESFMTLAPPTPLTHTHTRTTTTLFFLTPSLHVLLRLQAAHCVRGLADVDDVIDQTLKWDRCTDPDFEKKWFRGKCEARADAAVGPRFFPSAQRAAEAFWEPCLRSTACRPCRVYTHGRHTQWCAANDVLKQPFVRVRGWV